MLAGLGAVVAGLSCSDHATGPNLPVRVLLAPVLPNIPHLSQALGITNFRVIIGNPPKVDTSYAFGPTTDSIVVNLVVPNSRKGDALPATIQGRAGSTVLFAGTVTVTAQDAGSPIAPQSTPITIKYVGAGASAASISLFPKDTAVLFGDSLTYRAIGLDSLGGALSNIPLVMSVADTSVRVRLNKQPNTIVVPQRRGFAWIVGQTATGIKDSTRLFFTPVPVAIAKLSGDAQTGVVGNALPAPLTVQVKAADSSGVPNLAIQFSSLSGGQVTNAIVLTDTNGIASTPVTLGPITGAQQFQVVAPKLAPVIFSATATPGAPKNITIQTGNAQTGAVGAVLAVAPAVVIKDSLGNVVPGVKVYFTKVSSSTSRPVNDSTVSTIAGVATSGGWRMGAVPRADTLVATASVGSVNFTATATVAPAVKVIAAAGDGQTAIEGTTLINPLVAKVVDSLGNAVSGVTVNFATASGTLTPTSAVSNATGLASSSWTLPLGPGAKSATASVTTPAGVTPFTFSATALPVTPTLFVTILGSNVVGVLRSGILVVRTSAPVPVGAGPLNVALTSAAPNTLSLAASSLQILPGDSIGSVNVTGGGAAGTSTVTASAVGYVSGTLNVPVSLNLISAPLTFNVGLGQTTNLGFTLTSNTAPGGVVVGVASSVPSTVFVTTPTVSIPQNSTTGSASLRGDALGSASVALTNPNYAPFGVTVNVTANLKWKPITATVFVGGTPAPIDTIQLQSGGLPIAAPAGGVTVTLTSTNPTCVANGNVTIAAGSPNATLPINYAGTATLPCTAKLAASASAGVTPDTLSVTVNSKPTLNTLSSLTVGRGLQTSTFVGVVPISQHGGITVTMQVADSSKIRISAVDTVLGGGTATFALPNGATTLSYYVNALEGAGLNDTVSVTVSSPNFNSSTHLINLRNIALRLDNAPISGTTTLSARTPIWATVGYLATPGATVLSGIQNVRPGAPSRAISFISNSPAVARLRGGVIDTVTLADSLVALLKANTSNTSTQPSTGGMLLQPVGVGSDTLRLSTTDTTIFITPLLVQRIVPITAPPLNQSSTTVGRGLQTSVSFPALSVVAPPGGTTLSVFNPIAGTPVRLSLNDSTIAGDSIAIPLVANSNFVGFYVHALEGTGLDTAIVLRMHAPGYVDTTFTVNLRTASFQLISLPTTTTAIAPRTFFQVRVGYRNTFGVATINAIQPLRALAPPLTFFVRNDSLPVASLLTAADSVVGFDSVQVTILARQFTTSSAFNTGGVAFLPTGGGVTTVRAGVIGNAPFSPANFPLDTVTVTAPSMNPAFNGTVVGRGLQQAVFGTLLGTVAPAGGVTATITSLDSTKVKFGLNDSTLAGILQVNISAGQSGSTNYYVHALEGTGPNDTVFVQLSAPGYTPVQIRILRRTPAVQLISLPTSGFTTLTPPRLFQARLGYINLPTDTTIAAIQNLRAKAPPVTVTVTSSTPTVGKVLSVADSTTGLDVVTAQIVPRVSTTPGNLALGGWQLRPLTSGTYRVTKTASSAAQTFVSVNSAQDSAVVTSASIGAPAPFTIGAGLQDQTNNIFLTAPAPAGTKITIRSSDSTKVKVSPNALTAGADSIDIPIATNGSSFSYFIHGMEGATGTTTLLISAQGYTGTSQTVNVVASAVSLQATTSFQTFARGSLFALVGYPSGQSVVEQAVRIGAPGPLTATITSAASGVVGLLSPSDTSVGSGTATVQIPAGLSRTNSVATSPQFLQMRALSVGTSSVSVSIPGYAAVPFSTQTITITTPTISVSAATVGAGLQTPQNAFLSTSFHGGKTVTITSTDPAKLLLAPNDSTPGAASITVNVPDRTTTISYYVQGVEAQFGGVPVTISAPGYTTFSIRDSVAAPAVEISSFTGTSAPASPPGAANDRALVIRVGLPNTAGTSMQSIQNVRWNAATPTPLTITGVLTPSVPGVATLVNGGGTGLSLTVSIAAKQSQTAGILGPNYLAWRPFATGTATISVTSPGFVTFPTTSTRTVTVP